MKTYWEGAFTHKQTYIILFTPIFTELTVSLK